MILYILGSSVEGSHKFLPYTLFRTHLQVLCTLAQSVDQQYECQFVNVLRHIFFALIEYDDQWPKVMQCKFVTKNQRKWYEGHRLPFFLLAIRVVKRQNSFICHKLLEIPPNVHFRRYDTHVSSSNDT